MSDLIRFLVNLWRKIFPKKVIPILPEASLNRGPYRTPAEKEKKEYIVPIFPIPNPEWSKKTETSENIDPLFWENEKRRLLKECDDNVMEIKQSLQELRKDIVVSLRSDIVYNHIKVIKKSSVGRVITIPVVNFSKEKKP